jgi:hypothetical protein
MSPAPDECQTARSGLRQQMRRLEELRAAEAEEDRPAQGRRRGADRCPAPVDDGDPTAAAEALLRIRRIRVLPQPRNGDTTHLVPPGPM